MKIKINKTEYKDKQKHSMETNLSTKVNDKSEDGLLQARVSKVSLERLPQGQPEGQEEEAWTTWPSWTVTQGLPVTHMMRGDHKQEFT